MDNDELIKRCNEAEEWVKWLIVFLEDQDQDYHYVKDIKEAKEWYNSGKPKRHHI